MFVLFKTIISKPMISHFLYCPAQVSWSDGLVPFISFFRLAQESQSDDFLVCLL